MLKKIILLSDGTGNAAASIWRTNVWRIFQSIDLTGSDQVACYDDGVGTSSFKPLAMLGGAFGWGLKRNVIHLYKFLCRNYQAGCDVYAFGFSRGAFTIRVVMGLVAREGLVPYTTEDDLDGKAIAAYREFRRARYGFNLASLLRPFRDIAVKIKTIFLGREHYNSNQNIKNIKIRFLGLCDTVAAYGLPIDEWTLGIDRYIWPLELPDRRFWPNIEKACHALALDDERTTFHPVLWDEHSIPDSQLTQVWFAGMHSNVGGGYPDDSLAGVPLLWIMKNAEDAGLVFKVSPKQPDAVLVAESARDKDGRLYDSRAGLASYYRYGPRDVEALCMDKWNGVNIALPKVHESVFARMKSNATAYAPIGLPKNYTIEREDGTTAPQGTEGFETATNAATRYEGQQLVWNMVWWRRVFYFLTVAASLNLVLFPLLHHINRPGEYTTTIRFIPELLRIAGEFLPDFVTTWWLNSFATNPEIFLISVVALAVTMMMGLRLGTIIEDRMLAAWQLRAPPRNGIVRALDAFVQSFRRAAWYQWLIQRLKYRVAPLFFALLTIYVVGAFVSHVAFYTEDAFGLTCTASGNAEPLGVGLTSRQLTFDASNPCFATGVKLTAGVRYVITIESAVGWQDGSFASDLSGYDISALPSLWNRAVMLLETPLRRVLLRPWFRIIARVGETGTDEYFLDPDAGTVKVKKLEVPFYPHRTGELFLYVNDVVLPGFVQPFYENNHGAATVTIAQRDPPRR